MKISKIKIDKIINYLHLGLSLQDICKLVNINSLELYELFDSNKAVYDAKELGMLSTKIKVIEGLLKCAVGHTVKEKTTETTYIRASQTIASKRVIETKKDVPPNLAAIKFWLQTKHQDEWKDIAEKVENELNIKISMDGKDITVKNKKEKE